MVKNISFLLIILLLSACKQQQKATANTGQQNPEIVFSLSTSPCFGACPVYNLQLYDDSTLYFEGKEHTKLEGEHREKLSEEEYEAFIGLIETVKWEDLNPRYVSDMTDLPSQDFYYNFEGTDKRVYQYGLEPKSLSNLTRAVLPFVYEVFEVE